MGLIRFKKPEDLQDVRLFEFVKPLSESLFKIVGWCMVVSVLKYAATKTDILVVVVASYLMHFALAAYFYGLIVANIEIQILRANKPGSPWIKHIEITGNLLLTFALYILAYFAIQSFVDAIVALQSQRTS